MKSLLFVTLVLSIAIISSDSINIYFPYEWKYIDFIWKNEEQRKQMIDSGDYNATACLLHDVDKAPDGRVFVAGYKTKGSPIAVSVVSKNNGTGGPLLDPYPSLDWWTNTSDCITGFYRLRIKCNHLFVVHSGKFKNWEEEECPARLLIFDLSTNELVKKIIIPPEIANNKNGSGLLMTSFIDAQTCHNIANTGTIYITDTEGYGLVTYEAKESKFCRFESDFMKPTDTNFVTEKGNFTLEEGIYGLTVINQRLYYVVTSGKHIFEMNTSKLKCSSNEQSINETNEMTKVVATLPDQIDGVASKECALFFTNVVKGSVMCADSSKKIDSNNMVTLAKDPEKLILPCSLKVPGNELMGMINNYQDFLIGKQNTNETQFRIFVMDMKEIQSKTKCFDSCREKNVIENLPGRFKDVIMRPVIRPFSHIVRFWNYFQP